MKQILKTSYSILLLLISFSFLQASDKQIVQCAAERSPEEYTSHLVTGHINDIKDFLTVALQIHLPQYNQSCQQVFKNIKKITKSYAINFLAVVEQDENVNFFELYIQMQERLRSLEVLDKSVMLLAEYTKNNPLYKTTLLKKQRTLIASRDQLLLYLQDNRGQASYAKNLMHVFYEQYFVHNNQGW